MEKVLVIDITVSNDNIEHNAVQIIKQIKPTWNYKDIKFKTFTDGITNKLVGIYQKDSPEDMILIRIYGVNTHLLIDRNAEKSNFKILHAEGLAPKLFAEFTNGLVYEYVKGVTTNVETIRDPNVYPLVATTMAKLHKVHSNNKISKVWARGRHMLGLIPQQYNTPEKKARFESLFPGGKNQLELDFLEIERQLLSSKSPVVFCHNDLLLGNVIYNAEMSKVTFIDYEYAEVNYQAFDLANHFCEFAGVSPINHNLYPNQEFQLNWLKIYYKEFYGKPASTQELSVLYWQVQQFSPLPHLLWTFWGLVQAHHSDLDFDFFDYCKSHYEGFKLKKKY